MAASVACAPAAVFGRKNVIRQKRDTKESSNGASSKELERNMSRKRSRRSDESSEDGGIDESDGDEQEEGTVGNAGWADAMLRVLKSDIPSTDFNAAKNSRRDGRRRKISIILSRGKTDREVAETRRKKEQEISSKKDDFEIERNLDEVVVDDTSVTPTTSDVNARPEKLGSVSLNTDMMSYKDLQDLIRQRRLERKCWEDMGRVKPDITKREKERFLQKVATAGVVQLFNAVKQRQTAVETKLKKVGGSEIKRDKVLKSMTKQDFLDVLKKAKSIRPPLATKTLKSTNKDKQEDGEAEANPTWEVLREEYMMGAQMKDWDKASDKDDDNDDGEGVSS